MATINFYLEKPNRLNQCKIMMVYQSSGKKFKHATQHKVDKKSWDSKKQKVKPSWTGAMEINALNEKLRNEVLSIERELLFKEIEPTAINVKAEFLAKLKGKSGKDFFSVFERFLEYTQPIISEGYYRRHKAVGKKLKEFIQDKNYPLDFKTVNNEFYSKYVEYLIEEHNLLNNTIGNHIKTIKAFMKYATEQGFNKQMDFMKFKVFREDTELIYLTEEELINLYELEIDSERLKGVRDNFCFACFTGVRFSDLSTIKKENINNEFLTIKTEKTREVLKIPLNRYAQAILEKYDYKLPKAISNQKMNKYLKELGKLAEIDDKVHITQYSGHKKIETFVEKWEKLSTHCARRTFVTLSLEKGLRPEVVMKITGHKNYNTFKKYIKLTDKVLLNEINRIW